MYKIDANLNSFLDKYESDGVLTTGNLTRCQATSLSGIHKRVRFVPTGQLILPYMCNRAILGLMFVDGLTVVHGAKVE